MFWFVYILNSALHSTVGLERGVIFLIVLKGFLSLLSVLMSVMEDDTVVL